MQKTSDKYRDFVRSIFVGIGLGILFAVVFFAGFFIREVVEMPAVFASSSNTDSEDEYFLLPEVQALIDNHYLREQPDFTQRQYAAVRGLLSSLDDRNTFFIEPAVARSESDVLAGTYGGIGTNLSRNEDGFFVLFPFPDGPATEAGVLDNDIIVSINGQGIDVATQQDIIDQMLRGEVGDDNGVEITLRRDGFDEDITLFVPFDVINIPSVLWRVLPNNTQIGYIQVMRFTNRTPDEFLQAIDELNVSNIEALILDLRGNGGGLLNEAVDVAGEFFDGGVVLYERTRNNERIFEAEIGGSVIELPLVVLVNSGTASAAELVAGALQDYGRGLLIGQNTYGKGTIQQIFGLSDTSSIHITSAEWFTPNRNAIDGVGLSPDISMIPDENGRDIEIGEAIRYLQEELGLLEGEGA